MFLFLFANLHLSLFLGDIEDSSENKTLIKQCRFLLKHLNACIASQKLDRDGRFINEMVRDDSAFGDKAVGPGDILAFVYLMDRGPRKGKLGGVAFVMD